MVSLLVCQVPGPYRRPELLLLRLSLEVFFFDRSARFVGENDFKDRMSQRPCADMHVSDGPLYETWSGLPRACETELKRLVSESWSWTCSSSSYLCC